MRHRDRCTDVNRAITRALLRGRLFLRPDVSIVHAGYAILVSTDRNLSYSFQVKEFDIFPFPPCSCERANVSGPKLVNGQNSGQVPSRRLANGRDSVLVRSWSQTMSRLYAACSTKRNTNFSCMTCQTGGYDDY